MSKAMNRYGFPRGWVPGVNEMHASAETVMRADNFEFDESGGMKIRRGSRIYHLGNGSPVSDIHSVVFDDPDTPITDQEKQRAWTTEDGHLYIDGVSQSVLFDGEGDIPMASGLGHMFAARGTVGKKWNGNALHNWAIEKPLKAPTVQANAALTTSVATFATGATPAALVIQGATPGAASHVTGYDGTTANGAVEGVPDAEGRFVIRRLWTTDQDFFTIGGTDGDDTDLFDIWVAFDTPEEFEYLELVFGCDASSTIPFQKDFFSFKFQPQKVVDAKDATLTMRRILDQMQETTQDAQSAEHLLDPIPDNYPSVESIVAGVGLVPTPHGPVSTSRWDSIGASPAWVHFTVPRSSFDRTGNTPGRGWATVRGFQVIYKTKLAGQVGKVYLDDCIVFGGGIRAYTGTFKFRYRFVRDDGRFLDFGPPSDASEPITVNQQGFTVTIPDEAISSRDPQLTHIWIYVYGGYMDGYYRCARVGVSGRNPASMGLSEYQLVADGSGINHNYDRARWLAFTGITTPSSATFSLAITILKGELDVLAENVYLDPGVIPLPSEIVGITGPYQNRMWILTRGGGVYPTMARRPGTFRIYDAKSVGSKAAIPLWIEATTSGVYVGTTKDVIRIYGSGDTNEAGSVDFQIESLGVGTPPFGASQVCRSGNLVFYRAAETVEQFNGASTTHVNSADIKELVDGERRFGIAPWDKRLGARYRLAYHEGRICILVPEFSSSEVAPAASTNVLYRVSPSNGRWVYHTFPFYLTAIHVEPDGTLLGGCSDGNIVILDDAESALDEQTPIEYKLWTREDYDGRPQNRKDLEDLHVLIDSSNAHSVNIGVYSQDVLLKEVLDVPSASSEIVKASLLGLAPVRSVQLRIEGNAYYGTTFTGYRINYQLRPELRWAVDCSYDLALPSNVVGVREVRFFAQLGADVTLTPYFHGVAQTPITVTALPGIFKLYRVKLGRALQGQPRFTLATTRPSESSENGMEIAFIELRQLGEGTNSDKQWKTVYSGSDE